MYLGHNILEPKPKIYCFCQVLMAVGITSILVIALTVFAWQTKFDFTAMGGVLLVRYKIFRSRSVENLVLPAAPKIEANL